MKKLYFLLCAAFVLLITSCGGMYQFVQVFETQPIESETHAYNGGLLYENETCAIYYSFWSRGGDASFEFYNKTDKIIYLDLTKSFFIRNGFANDYYHARTWSAAETNSFGSQTTIGKQVSKSVSEGASISVGKTYIGDFGQMPVTSIDPITTNVSASASSSVNYGALRSTYVTNNYATTSSVGLQVEEQPIVAIPPKSSKIIESYSINSIRLLYCNLERYPRDLDKITFTIENTPIRYTNYITYNFGEGSEDKVLKNSFYISAITNYAKPMVVKFEERTDSICDNLKNSGFYPDYKPTTKLYDPVMLLNCYNLFYIDYKVQSGKMLYKKEGPNLIYDPQLEAYRLPN